MNFDFESIGTFLMTYALRIIVFLVVDVGVTYVCEQFEILEDETLTLGRFSVSAVSALAFTVALLVLFSFDVVFTW